MTMISTADSLYNPDPPSVWQEKSGQAFPDEVIDMEELKDWTARAAGGIPRSAVEAVLAEIERKQAEYELAAGGSDWGTNRGAALGYGHSARLLRELLDDAHDDPERKIS